MYINTITPAAIWDIFEEMDYLGFSCEEQCAQAFLTESVDCWDYSCITEGQAEELKMWRYETVKKYNIPQAC